MQCLPPNPRRLKGLANLLQRLAPLLPEPDGERDMIFEAKTLLVVAYVYQFHNDLFVRWEYSPEMYQQILTWVRGQEGKRPLAVFDGLHRAFTIVSDPTAAAAEFSVQTAFPDPTASNEFWIGPLLNELGDTATEATFAPYLHGVRP